MENAFINYFKEHNVKLTNESLNKLLKITNIRNEEFLSKPSNKLCYKWFCEYDGQPTALNFVRSNGIDIPIQKLCLDCNKELSLCFLSDLISFTHSKDINSLKCPRTFIRRCKRCASSANSINGLEKRKKICMERHGVPFRFNDPAIIKAMPLILTQRYGENYQEVFTEKRKQTFFEKHGVTHNTHVPEIQRRMVETRKETIKAMSPEQINKWNENKLNSYKREGSPGLFGRHEPHNNSKIALELINNIISTLNLSEDQYITEKPCLRYFIDLYIKDTVILEFYGDFWHGNPEVYKANDLIGIGTEKIIVEEQWISDENRLEAIKKELQLPAIIVWEKSYKQDKEKILIDIIKNINIIRSSKNHETKTYIY